MATLVFQRPDGESTTIAANGGISVMEAATRHGISGIVAECGGSAACATCHVFVLEGPGALFLPVSTQEDQMLDCTAEERRPESRLSCQLTIPDTDAVFVFQIPARQI